MAKAEAEKIVSRGQDESKRAYKEAVLKAKEQELELRNNLDRETKEKRAELQKLEQRLTQKEDSLDKKLEGLEEQKKNLAKQEDEVKELQAKLNSQHDLMVQELEKVAHLTAEEAKKILMDEILDSTRHDVAIQVRNMEQQAKNCLHRQS